MPDQPSVRAAHARLAALRRHRAADDPAVVQARRDLEVARARRDFVAAATMTAEATVTLAGEGS